MSMSFIDYTNQQNQQLGLFNLRPKSILYVFEPDKHRAISNQALRPLLYNIDDTTAYLAAEAVTKSVAGNPGALPSFLSSRNVSNSLLPKDAPSAILNMQTVSDNWRFMLVCDTSDVGNRSTFSPLQSHRIVATGYFSDVPINLATGALNDMALMTFTHKTVIENLQTSGINATSTMSSPLNVQITPLETQMFSTNPDLQVVDPTASYKATSRAADGKHFTYPNYTSALTNQSKAPQFSANLSIARNNLEKVLGNVAFSYKTANTMGTANNYDGLSPSSHLMKQTYFETLDSHMDSISVSSHDELGPNVNSTWSLGRVRQTWDVDVQPVNSRGSQYVNVFDQGEISPRMVYSSILSSAIPAVMTKWGIGGISFEYSTNYDLPTPMPPGIRIKDASSLLTYPQSTLQSRINSLFQELEVGIFQTLYSQRKDFHLVASFNSAGMTYILLNFRADQMIDDAYYETPTLLDGLVSPMLGDKDAVTQNASQLSNLFNAVYDDQIMPDQTAEAMASYPYAEGIMGGHINGVSGAGMPAGGFIQTGATFDGAMIDVSGNVGNMPQHQPHQPQGPIIIDPSNPAPNPNARFITEIKY